jgi:bacterioferritin-associated ferredoxin
MIVCSCNILSDIQILAMLQGQDRGRPCSLARTYQGLGCTRRCGRCVPTIRALLNADNCMPAMRTPRAIFGS